MGNKDKEAGSRAAAEQNRFTQLGIDELRPFAQAGVDQLGALTQGTTAGGLDERLASIFNTDTFGSLVDERTRAVQGQLGAGGLTRSGTAIQEAANIPTEIGLAIEQLLTGRSQGLAQQGLGATGGIVGQLGQQGQASASGILSDAQAGSAAVSQILSIGSALLFSDPRLKTNVEKISEIGPLGLYEWD